MAPQNNYFAILCAAFSISGCGNQYSYRGDSISLNHGDAVRSNIAVMVTDPWPAKSSNTNIPMDPVKAQYSVECYRLGKRPSDPLGPLNVAYGMGGKGSGASDTSCQETGAKATAPQGSENLNIERTNNEIGNPQYDPNSVVNSSSNRNSTSIVDPQNGALLLPSGPNNYTSAIDGSPYIGVGPNSAMDPKTGRIIP